MGREAARLHREGKTIALVPTMGYLHEGHLSLLRAGRDAADILVISIFVNPLQFGANEDFNVYPRDMERDLELAESCGVDIVFAPAAADLYPGGFSTFVEVEGLTETLCGLSRPGHFRGVTTVVCKLFNLTRPDLAFFGRKDFQQLAVIRRMSSDLDLGIEIVGMPIVREPDGLAMSSRNQLLKPNEREAAPLINQTLTEAAEKYRSLTPGEIKDQVINTLNEHPLMQVEYFDIVDSETLESISDWDSAPNKIGCIAVHLGEVRLIDNRYFI